MEAESVELEDGEIVDNEPLDVFASYNILKRPDNVAKIDEPLVINYSESDDSLKNASDSDESDSDSARLKSKKPKVSTKRLRKKVTKNEANKDKYKVWLGQVQEEILTENLVSCEVTKNGFCDRSVESYDFKMLRNMNDRGTRSSDEERDDEKDHKQVRRFTNKRTHSDRRNGKLRLENGISRLGLGRKNDESRQISELSITANSDDAEVAQDITDKLGEEKTDLIRRVVDIIGKEKAIEFYEKTKRIEEDGGMLIMNGSRRRTPGGVYLFLVKNDRHIPRSDIREIFIQDRKDHDNHKRKSNVTARNERVADLRKRLENNPENDLPALLTRAELSTRQIAEEARLRRGTGMDRIPTDSDRTVSNPPPSPVTDDPDHSEQNEQSTHVRRIQSYNDDILDLGLHGDSMDLF